MNVEDEEFCEECGWVITDDTPHVFLRHKKIIDDIADKLKPELKFLQQKTGTGRRNRP